jgi:hypothetical protein
VLIRIVANRKTSKAKVGLGDSDVSRPVELFDAVMRGFGDLRRRCRNRSPYWVKVYAVGQERDWLLAAFLTTDTPEEIDNRCGQVFGQIHVLAVR